MQCLKHIEIVPGWQQREIALTVCLFLSLMVNIVSSLHTKNDAGMIPDKLSSCTKREYAEWFVKRALVRQEWNKVVDAFTPVTLPRFQPPNYSRPLIDI